MCYQYDLFASLSSSCRTIFSMVARNNQKYCSPFFTEAKYFGALYKWFIPWFAPCSTLLLLCMSVRMFISSHVEGERKRQLDIQVSRSTNQHIPPFTAQLQGASSFWGYSMIDIATNIESIWPTMEWYFGSLYLLLFVEFSEMKTCAWLCSSLCVCLLSLRCCCVQYFMMCAGVCVCVCVCLFVIIVSIPFDISNRRKLFTCLWEYIGDRLSPWYDSWNYLNLSRISSITGQNKSTDQKMQSGKRKNYSKGGKGENTQNKAPLANFVSGSFGFYFCFSN